MNLDRIVPLSAAALLFVLLTGCAPATEPIGGLEISNARVRQLLPGQDKTAAYFEVTNRGAATRSILSAHCEGARAIEFHTTQLDDAIVRMRRLSELRIEPGATLSLQPGGGHLMLFGVRSVDDPTLITLQTADGTTIPVSFRRVAPGE